MGLGIEGKLADMDPKLNKLFQNILSIMLIIFLLYGLVTFVMVTLSQGYMAWFTVGYMGTIIIAVVMLLLASHILKGGKLNVPNQFQTKGKKQQFNMPNPYGVQSVRQKSKQPQQQQRQYRQPKQRPKTRQTRIEQYQSMQPTGTWKCKCGYLAMGNVCRNCGRRRI